MSALEQAIGKTAGPFEHRVDMARVRRFASLVGHEGSAIPPTYITVCREGEFELFQALGLPLSRVLHAEQEYAYESLEPIPEVLSYSTALSHVAQKRGSAGGLAFLTLETVIHSGRGGRRLAHARTTVVVKGEI